MKIAITGAYGLLGQELIRYFKTRSGWKVIALGHEDLDITKAESIAPLLKRIRPDVLINCAVIINIDKCEEAPELAYAVNRDAPLNLAMIMTKVNPESIFVQISSSEVFGGWKEGEYKIDGYREDDKRNPISIYQKSKAEAEDLLRSFTAALPDAFGRWYIVRAAWLYGQGRETFVEKFLRMLESDQEITVVPDQWRSPTWTRDFAQGLAELLEGKYPNGIYHIANEVRPGEATVMDVIEVIREHLHIPAEALRLKKVQLRKFFKIPRAPSNVLLNTKLPKLRYWRETLQEYLRLRHTKS